MKTNVVLKGALIFLMLAWVQVSNGQNRVKKFGKEIPGGDRPCAATDYENYLRSKNPQRQTAEEFEQWLAPKTTAAKFERFLKNGNSTVVTIPVVFHIIHNGDAVGVNENIADEQILSQITVLNQDFRKMEDTPGHNTNPVGADMEIEFCLAKRDPSGQAATGIVRHHMNHDGDWSMNEIDMLIKAQTQWDPNQYMNIWVVVGIVDDFIGDPIAGYGQYPIASGLEGLPDEADADTDGIVLGYLYCGSRIIYPEGVYDQWGKDEGGVGTHEVGHFLGLRHVWGDGGCEATDYCDDTPAAMGPNWDCPPGLDSCPEPGIDMTENYMDYTTDFCMNLFTLNQKDRVLAVLNNSPRRASLITSLGCVPPPVFDNDGSLNELNLNLDNCAQNLAPSMILHNAGHNTLTSVTINYGIDDNEPEIFEWVGNLVHEEQVVIQLPELTPDAGEHELTVLITAVNGVADENLLNDLKEIDFTLLPQLSSDEIVVTLQTDFDAADTSWSLRNSDNAVVASGSNFANNTFTIQQIEDLNAGCYTFTIVDEAGNGLCCNAGMGYYRIEAGGILIKENSNFGLSEVTEFSINGEAMSVKDFILDEITLYPNPAGNNLTISVPDNKLPDSYTIFNNLGQVMDTVKVNSEAMLTINTSAYSTGIYSIRIERAEQIQTLRFAKN